MTGDFLVNVMVVVVLVLVTGYAWDIWQWWRKRRGR